MLERAQIRRRTSGKRCAAALLSLPLEPPFRSRADVHRVRPQTRAMALEVDALVRSIEDEKVEEEERERVRAVLSRACRCHSCMCGMC